MKNKSSKQLAALNLYGLALASAPDITDAQLDALPPQDRLPQFYRTKRKRVPLHTHNGKRRIKLTTFTLNVKVKYTMDTSTRMIFGTKF